MEELCVEELCCGRIVCGRIVRGRIVYGRIVRGRIVALPTSSPLMFTLFSLAYVERYRNAVGLKFFIYSKFSNS